MGVRMEIDGLRQVTNAVRQLCDDAPEIEKRALQKAADMVVDAARANTPVLTGLAASEITATKVAKGINDGSTSVKVGVRRNKGVAYVVPLEWGHLNPDGSITPPAAFMARTYEEKKAEAYDIIRQSIGDELKGRFG